MGILFGAVRVKGENLCCVGNIVSHVVMLRVEMGIYYEIRSLFRRAARHSVLAKLGHLRSKIKFDNDITTLQPISTLTSRAVLMLVDVIM